jgi:hypothetical protein
MLVIFNAYERSVNIVILISFKEQLGVPEISPRTLLPIDKGTAPVQSSFPPLPPQFVHCLGPIVRFLFLEMIISRIKKY